jgi:hypothetical protein
MQSPVKYRVRSDKKRREFKKIGDFALLPAIHQYGKDLDLLKRYLSVAHNPLSVPHNTDSFLPLPS